MHTAFSRQILYCIFLVLIQQTLHAQFGPEQVLTTCEVCEISSVATGDLDKDGSPDIVIAGRQDGKIVWLRNKGQDQLDSVKVLFDSQQHIGKIYVLDLDQDGWEDILYIAEYDYQMAWLKNEGKGQFQKAQVIASKLEQPEKIALADFDQDGDMDIITGSYGGSSIRLYVNAGKGEFEEPIPLLKNISQVRYLYATDLNDDGLEDIIVATRGRMDWFKNEGENLFSERQQIAAEYALENLKELYVADFTGDGKKDIVFISYSFGPFLYAGTAEGQFSGKSQIDDQLGSVATGIPLDVDGDQQLDLVLSTAEHRNAKIVWFQNRGGGSFSPAQIVKGGTRQEEALSSADLDGDGYQEIISGSRSDDVVAWYRYQKDKNKLESQTLLAPQAIIPINVSSADIDQDGKVDILFTSLRDNKIAWYRNLGKGSFGKQQIIPSSLSSPRNLYVVDLDQDGDPDVFSSNGETGKMVYFENQGKGIFAKQKEIGEPHSNLWSIFATDIDQDGRLDIVVGAQSGNNVTWYRQGAGQTFSLGGVIAGKRKAYGTQSVYAADLNGDGLVDVLSASVSDDKVAWYPNLGGGNFGPQSIIMGRADGANRVRAADLDGDGDQDVVATLEYAGRVVWFKNDGTGQFEAQKDLQDGVSFASALFVADVNQDKRLDVVYGSRDGALYWNQNTGKGTFQETKIIAKDVLGLSGLNEIHGADFDQDGYIDLTTICSYMDKVVWFKFKP
ncbi:MAG: VCBS repeat-containing protein [Saprospiraceae bacterium]|nr:VCBS repeat-containing protein [Saprospiraceae bacterium]